MFFYSILPNEFPFKVLSSDYFPVYDAEYFIGPVAGKHKVYFDHGTATLDALYPSFQKQADAIRKQHGYTSEN